MPPLAFAFGVVPVAFVLVFLAAEAAKTCGWPAQRCLAQWAFGIRCPGCGVTRSIAALMRGDFTTAMKANVAGPLVCAYFVANVAGFAAAVRRLRTPQVLAQWKRRSERLLLHGLVAAWFWHSITT